MPPTPPGRGPGLSATDQSTLKTVGKKKPVLGQKARQELLQTTIQQSLAAKAAGASAPTDARVSPAARSTRSSSNNGALSEDGWPFHDIDGAETGRQYLESKLLMVPAGAPVSFDRLAHALHQTAAIPGISRPAVSAIRAIAYMLEELREQEREESLSNTVNFQLEQAVEQLKTFTGRFTSEIKEMADKKIQEVSTSALEATRAASNAVEELTQTAKAMPSQPPTESFSSYKDALLKAVAAPRIDPRIRAKEGIRARQFLFDLPLSSPLKSLSQADLLVKLNGAMDDSHKIRTVLRLRNGGILAETATDEGADWLRDKGNAWGFRAALDIPGDFKDRSFAAIAFYVPISFRPEISAHMQEFYEVNNLSAKEVPKARWAKPENRRHPTQSTGHLIITFAHQDLSNDAMVRGLVFCGKKVSIAKCKKEPLRCLKCHGWNHMAAECSKENDTCGTCGGEHRTSTCISKGVRFCVSCNSNSHASWDRECPTFVRKCAEYDQRNPENTLPYYPSKEPWTWESAPQAGPAHSTPAVVADVQFSRPRGSQKTYQSQLRFDRAQVTEQAGRPLQRATWTRGDSAAGNQAESGTTVVAEEADSPLQFPSSPTPNAPPSTAGTDRAPPPHLPHV